METRTKVVVGGIVFAVIGFLMNPLMPLGSVVWGPPADHGSMPEGVALVGILVYTVLESVAFGVGAMFVVFGWPLVRRASTSLVNARAAFVAIAWCLMSWVPHSALHMTNGPDEWLRLVGIEYAFHATIIASAMVLGRFLMGAVRVADERRAAAGSAIADAGASA